MKDLMALLPQELHYDESPEMTAIQNALTAAGRDVWDARDGFAAQLSPETATWGLDAWEEALAITPQDRADLPARRRAVIAKLRGVGTSTPARIASVAEAHLGGASWVVEYASEYLVEVWVRGMTSPPDSFEALTRALKEIMPAHLRWSYGVLFSLEPFINDPDKFTLARFIQSVAFSHRRNFASLWLDGTVPLDGSALLNSVPTSMFAFPRLHVGAALPANHESISRAALVVGDLYTLDGSVLLDGSRNLDSHIKQEDL